MLKVVMACSGAYGNDRKAASRYQWGLRRDLCRVAAGERPPMSYRTLASLRNDQHVLV